MSTGKIPDAREEARKIQAMNMLGAELPYAIADIQKRTLLAVAEQIRQKYHPGNMNLLNAAIELLERRAEEIGRQG